MTQISPRVDIAFKKIFGVEENKDLLISLINSIVSKEDQIESVTLLNPYNPRNHKDSKLSILDIKAEGHDGKKFNIEIQISDEADYDKRALYYWAKLYTEQIGISDKYAKLSKTIGIHILNFMSVPEAKDYHNVFRIKAEDAGIKCFEDLELHTIELTKFTGADNDDMLSRVKTALELWLAFLTRHDLFNKDNMPESSEGKNICKALDVLECMNFTRDEREIYDGHMKWLMVEAATLRKHGETCREEGREEGREEERLRTANTLLSLGVSIEVISKTTGLSDQQIKNLK